MISGGLQIACGSAGLQGRENRVTHRCRDVEFLGSARNEEKYRNGVKFSAAGI
jgi:hypothetical protein